MVRLRPLLHLTVAICTAWLTTCSPAPDVPTGAVRRPAGIEISADEEFLPSSLRWPLPAAAHGELRPPLHPPRTARLLFAGDVMQHLPQVAAARRADGSFDYTASFECVRPLFKTADLAVVNLETTLTESGPYSGYPCFRSPTALAGALHAIGTDVCALANNHCFDGGAAGVHTTLSVLDRLGIRHTGLSADTVAQRHPLLLEAGGIRFALLAYTYGTNGVPAPPGTAVARIDTAAMRHDLRQARTLADCTVVLMHWGNEYERQPNTEQRRLAAFLRCHGADVVIGSHPHVAQPCEIDSTGAVFYSLGNFVSNQRRRHCDGGILARVTVVQRSDGSLHFAADALPVWVQLPGYRILTPEAADTAATTPADRNAWVRFADETRRLLAPYDA